MAINSTIVISHDYFDWIKRNPALFVNGLVTRMEQGEADPHPGYSRWRGDAMPGVQVVSVDHSSTAVVIIAGGNGGRRVAATGSGRGGFPSDEDALRAFADRLGFTVQKKSERSSAPQKKYKKKKQLAANKKR